VGRGDEVVDAAVRSAADVALLDIEMPGMDGIAAASALRSALPVPDAHRHHLRTARVSDARDAGGSVRLRREGHARRAARRRGAPRGAGAAGRRSALAADSLAQGESPLTARETDVLAVARTGGSIADIAQMLHLSEGTVRNHLSSAIGKTGARNRADAVRVADENGWL
jgi:two-component system response regulator DesR